VWRATFIDVEEEQSLELRCGGRRPRARSLPCSLTPMDDIFAPDKSYVAELSARLAECVTVVSQKRGSACCLSQVVEPQPPSAQNPHTQLSNGVVSSLLLRAKVKDEHRCGKAVTTDGDTREPSSGALASIDGESSSPACNTGSIGHPLLCSRPCLYFATAGCANGESCDFCHLPHAKRPPHLSKQHREQLRDMEAGKVKALILQIARTKARAFDASEDTALAVDRLAEACGVAGPSRVRLVGNERSLGVALNSMNLKLLLATLHRAVLPDESEAWAAADALLARLRSVA